jgi:hypothetical protein
MCCPLLYVVCDGKMRSVNTAGPVWLFAVERSSHIVPLVISTDHACMLLHSLRQLFANGNRLRSVPETLCFLPDLQVMTTVVCAG